MSEMPGVPLPSGFEDAEPRPTQLPDDARRRVEAKMDSVRRARALAEASAHTAVICSLANVEDH